MNVQSVLELSPCVIVTNVLLENIQGTYIVLRSFLSIPEGQIADLSYLASSVGNADLTKVCVSVPGGLGVSRRPRPGTRRRVDRYRPTTRLRRFLNHPRRIASYLGWKFSVLWEFYIILSPANRSRDDSFQFNHFYIGLDGVASRGEQKNKSRIDVYSGSCLEIKCISRCCWQEKLKKNREDAPGSALWGDLQTWSAFQPLRGLRFF